MVTGAATGAGTGVAISDDTPLPEGTAVTGHPTSPPSESVTDANSVSPGSGSPILSSAAAILLYQVSIDDGGDEVERLPISRVPILSPILEFEDPIVEIEGPILGSLTDSPTREALSHQEGDVLGIGASVTEDVLQRGISVSHSPHSRFGAAIEDGG
ncbi:hypothetical protein Dimus_022460 [Dionaea muscipula]